MPNTCRACIHPERREIDRALIAGESHRSVAERFGLSASCMFRHRQSHLPRTLVEAREVQRVEHGTDLLGRVEGLYARACELLAKAEAAGDYRGALAGIREARGCLELLGKATGELRERHEVAGAVEVKSTPTGSAVVSALRAVLDQMRERYAIDVTSSPHVLSGEAARPRPEGYQAVRQMTANAKPVEFAPPPRPRCAVEPDAGRQSY